MATRRGWWCSFLELVQEQNNNKQKGVHKNPCAVQMERSDPPPPPPPQPCEPGKDKLRNSFKHVQRSLSGHRQAHRCEERVKKSGSERAEETYRMDQPQDHKKGHVDLYVHTTTQGDRHPITQYMWSRPSVEYHLPTRSKSRIVVVERWGCQTRTSKVICDSTAVQ